MKFCVLASNSFTGSHFVQYLLENTDATVLGFSRSPEYHQVLLPYLYRAKERPKRFRFHQLDVNTQLPALLALLDVEKCEYIVNFAAQGEVRNSWKWPEQWYQTNTMAVVQLSNELVKRDYIKKYVVPSTPEVYGSTGAGKMKECHQYSPSTPYGVSKLAGDLHLLALWKRYQFPVCMTRAANLYGIHQQLYRIIPRTIIYRKLGKTIDLHGGGRARRSFIHARDVADATYKACLNGAPGEIYHLAPENEEFTIAQVVQLICERMGHSYEQSVNLVHENFGQDDVFSLDSQKIRRELGWAPRVAFADGVQEMISWISDNWQVIKDLPHEYIHKV